MFLEYLEFNRWSTVEQSHLRNKTETSTHKPTWYT